MKKVIFLDLDGVLNSPEYDAQRNWSELSYIDETRLPILSRIIYETGAEIVFSSSWREHWDADENKCDEDGKYIISSLGKFGIKISDKTEIIKNGDKADEIALYIKTHDDIANYVILEDDFFFWGAMSDHVIKISKLGRGLEEYHALKAIEILNGKKVF